jgi:hypothetical protein
MKPEQSPDLASGTSRAVHHRGASAPAEWEVYEAVPRLGKRVAIKTLRRVYAATVVTRFLAKDARLSHSPPHIVDATDVGMIDGLRA